MNIARGFAYTRFLEDELAIARTTIDSLLAKIPDVRTPQPSNVSKPVEFKPILRRPLARDFIQSEEKRLHAESLKPKSNITVPETLEAT